MSDIVERLKFACCDAEGEPLEPGQLISPPLKDVQCAIIEIEKLRRENEIIVGMINDMGAIVIKARASLGEKD
jgi:hypothetical protein